MAILIKSEYHLNSVKEHKTREIIFIVRVFILQTGILWLLGLFFVDMTHSSSSVNLIPAAEDEAGLSVIHPEDRQRDEQKKKQTRRFTGWWLWRDQSFKEKLGSNKCLCPRTLTEKVYSLKKTICFCLILDSLFVTENSHVL